ncbi:MAG: hypothetical protein C0505_19410 [Leptothrix sp. (in: Bacteria)]|nr:hypothetical protein [Leptothrix sp. (in: b-proteobacteria)]
MARPFRWSNGVMTQIGPGIDTTQFTIAGLSLGGGHQRAMNNVGQVVATQKINGVNHAVLWEHGVITDLNPVLGLSSASATGINDAGQIIAGNRKIAPTIPGVDMGIVMTGAPVFVVQGQSITYSLTVTNSGTQTATGASLTNTLPVGVRFVAATTSQGYRSGSSTVACVLGTMAAGASASAQITATVTSTGTLLNTASVSSSEVDVNPLNNNATYTNSASAPIVKADLSVSMTDSPDPVRRRSNLTYTITVQNAGPGSASSVSVTDSLPSTMTFVSASSSQGSCSGTSTVNCNLGTLASGASARVSILVQPRLTGSYTNTVSVRTTTQESSASNNTATAVTQVR